MQCFLIYIDDWLSSKKIEMMDRDEELAYFHMLLKAAKEYDCGLPDNDNMLAVISGLGPQWFKPSRDKMKRFGELTSGGKLRQSFTTKDGRIFNERLVREWTHQKEVAAKRLASGKLGGRPKKPNDNQTVNQTVNQKDNQKDNQTESKSLANGKQNETNHSLGLGLVVVSKKELPSDEFDIELKFAEFINGWPDLSEISLAHSCYLDKVVSKSDSFAAHDKLMAAKDRWKRSKRWHRGYHKSPGKWLAEDKEDDMPEQCECGQETHVASDTRNRGSTSPHIAAHELARQRVISGELNED